MLESDRFGISIRVVRVGTAGTVKVELLENGRTSKKADHIRDARPLVSNLCGKGEM